MHTFLKMPLSDLLLTPDAAEAHAALIDEIVQFVRGEAAFQPMYQEDNPLVRMEKRMRKVLVEELRARGVQDPWLVEWWKYVEK